MKSPANGRRMRALACRTGEVLEQFRFELDEGRAERFVHALRAEPPVVPPTVLQASALDRNVVPHLELGLDAARVRHGEQRFTYRRDVAARPLEATVRLARTFTRGGTAGPLLFVLVETQFADQDGLVATSEMTLIEVPRELEGRKPRFTPVATEPCGSRPDLWRAEPPLTQDDLRRYADASGDRNPIHLDDDAARAAGLPGVVVMGMLPAGMLALLALKALNVRPIGELSFRFVRPIWPGEAMTLEARGDQLGLSLRASVNGATRIVGAALPRSAA